MTTLDERLATWTRAELTGDAHAFEELLHPDFLAVGPYGFLLDRDQWIKRFGDGLDYTAFAFAPDTEPRVIGDTAFVVGTQTHEGTMRDHSVDGSFRISLTFTGGPEWRLTAVHLSLRTPPTGPAS